MCKFTKDLKVTTESKLYEDAFDQFWSEIGKGRYRRQAYGGNRKKPEIFGHTCRV